MNMVDYPRFPASSIPSMGVQGGGMCLFSSAPTCASSCSLGCRCLCRGGCPREAWQGKLQGLVVRRPCGNGVNGVHIRDHLQTQPNVYVLGHSRAAFRTCDVRRRLQEQIYSQAIAHKFSLSTLVVFPTPSHGPSIIARVCTKHRERLPLYSPRNKTQPSLRPEAQAFCRVGTHTHPAFPKPHADKQISVKTKPRSSPLLLFKRSTSPPRR